jgi:hypothetical protein
MNFVINDQGALVVVVIVAAIYKIVVKVIEHRWPIQSPVVERPVPDA